LSRTESPELGLLGSLAVRFFSDPPAAPDNQGSSGSGASSDRSMLQGIAGGWGGENGANEGEASESKALGGSSILDSWSEAVDALSSFSLSSEELAELQNQIVESPSLIRFVTALGDINARALFVLKVRNWVVLFHNVLPCTSFPIFFYLS
jgi:hypothetical protein